MIKAIIHKDRHHKPLYIKQQRKKIHKAKIRRNIWENKIYIIIRKHINISLRMFYQVQKKIRIGAF